MKKLYLIRHAKSDWNDMSLSDFERPLNTRGKRNAPFMGEVLARNSIKPDLILSSPAIRAKTTAQIIAGKTHYPLDDILYADTLYLADVDALQTVVQSIPDLKETVFLFGHNPGLTLFAEYISGFIIDNIPTSGILCVTMKSDSWKNIGKDSTVFVSFDYPKKYE